jgi:hypothetical protein
VKRLWDDDELTTEWTLEPSDQPLLANKTGATRLGFAALLTFFRHEGRFPTGKHEVGSRHHLGEFCTVCGG